MSNSTINTKEHSSQVMEKALEKLKAQSIFALL